MREQLEARLAELEQEYEVGERRLRDVDLHQARLRETLMRMAGAIQVLQELLAASGASADDLSAPTFSMNGQDDLAASGAVQPGATVQN